MPSPTTFYASRVTAVDTAPAPPLIDKLLALAAAIFAAYMAYSAHANLQELGPAAQAARIEQVQVLQAEPLACDTRRAQGGTYHTTCEVAAQVKDASGQAARLLYGRYEDDEDSARRDHAALTPGAATSRYTVTIGGEVSQHGERRQQDMLEAGGGQSLLHMALWAGVAVAALLYLAASVSRGMSRRQQAALDDLP